MPKLAIFEDQSAVHLKPLVHTRAAFDLRSGIFSFKDRIERALGCAADHLICRVRVAQVAAEAHPGTAVNPTETEHDTLFVNGLWIPEEGQFLQMLRDLIVEGGLSAPRAFVSGAVVVAAWGDVDASDREDVGDVRIVSRLWQLVTNPGAQIADDARLFSEEAVPPAQWPDLTMVHEEKIRIHESAKFGAGVILNASKGPIVIEDEAIVADGAILIGPCHIGPKAQVRPGARITGSSIGYNSRAGGEISKSILFAHSNKAHDGYLGNSYIGEWCNLGADANTSNLRNDYGFVSLYNEELGRPEATGEQFVGLIMGDHSASGINSMFNTASVVGVCCNVFGADYLPRYIKSFSWGSKERMMHHRIDKALAAAKAMMARRDRTMSEAHRRLLEELDSATRAKAPQR